MTAYYNEIDPMAAQWLRELIKAGHIAPGEVDERSIEDVVPEELMGYTQCHFFAGIGVWSHALRQAGWPDDRPVWTGSCPCQPFSAAGKGGGTADERHLWPAFEWLIRECRPGVIFGEQVESAIKHDWLDHVGLSLEALGYAVGSVGFPACGYGAPHIRQRLYWLAELAHSRLFRREYQTKREGRPNYDGRSPTRLMADAEVPEYKGNEGQGGQALQLRRTGNAGIVGDSESIRHASGSDNRREGQKGEPKRLIRDQSLRPSQAIILGDAEPTGLQEQRRDGRILSSQDGAVQGKAVKRAGAPTNGFWSDCEWIPCRDGRARPVEPGTFPLVNGPAAGMVHRSDKCPQVDEIDPQNTAEARVMRLKGYGNAICAPQAAAFIRAYLDAV